MESISIRNGEIRSMLEGLGALSKLWLPFGAALTVRRAVKKLSDQWDMVEQERVKTAERFAAKDEAGKPKMTEKDEQGRQAFVIEDPGGFERAYGQLMDMAYELEETIDAGELEKSLAAEKNKLLVTPEILMQCGAFIQDGAK